MLTHFFAIESALLALPVAVIGIGASVCCGGLALNGLDKLLKISKQIDEFNKENEHPYVQGNLDEIK